MALQLVVLGLMLFQAASGDAAPAQEAPAAQAAPAAAGSGSAGSEAKAAPADGEATPAGGAPAGGANAQDPPPWMSFAPILFIGILFYFMLLRPQAREQKRRQELLNAVKKNDKVITTGGIIGTVADLSEDGRFVTLKVDDSTRIKFLRSAIHGPLDDKAAPPAAT
jgi:preprotein translocase subunit YajC